jgi:Domain of unknown function (DUF4375)
MKYAFNPSYKLLKRFLIVFFLVSFLSCGQTKNNSDIKTSNQFNVFDKENHLQPLFDKVKFDTLHGFDFGWAILEPINLAKSRDDDKELSKRFSPGQKALYFIWYLDDQVTNGGFVQFYLNDYREYILSIKDGLKLIGDTTMLTLVEKADKEYLIHQNKVDSYKQKNDWQPLYEKPYKFEFYDSVYYSSNKKMMGLIEKYIRQYPEEFVKFK